MGRLVYLDNLRSFALLLGIIFHAAIVYASDIKYAIQDEDRSDVLSYFCYWIHSYRMPMFYMISGFFSAMVWEKKEEVFIWKLGSNEFLSQLFLDFYSLRPSNIILPNESKPQS